MTIAFSGCKDDKDEPSPEPTPEPVEVTIVGTWQCIDDYGDSAILTLNADHTGSIRVTVDPTRATVTLTEYFNWNAVDDSNANHWLEVIHTKGDYWFEYTNMTYILAGNTLQLDGFIYTRIK